MTIVTTTVQTMMNAKQYKNDARQLKEHHVSSLSFSEKKSSHTVYLDQKELSHGVQPK